ncbi:MAG: 23S rRNA (adenine(2503)-C(2))-methyltransferase RlmN [Bacteroidetes bacterium]|nr:23S rRNA (adenine(2503)-C(2))-methyltransferase RlmN [Bacteroidota bacterium]
MSDIRELTPEEIKSFLAAHNEKPFRTRQVFEWLWKKQGASFDEMSDIPKACRELLKNHFTFNKSVPTKIQESSDGTVKIGFLLHDGGMVEGVLIPSGERFTACVSSQLGCPLACVFCATGKLGFTRNLSAGEIYDQAAYLNKLAIERTNSEAGLSNIVYMGMGEPMLNYGNVKRSIDLITSADGMGMSPQRITISSVGIPKMIKQIADDEMKCHFALSLHSAGNETRNRLVPYNLRHPVEDLREALKYYYKKTGKRFTIEYILFRDVNDDLVNARELAAFCRNFPVKVNLLEYNVVDGTGLQKSSPERMKIFAEFLEKKNMVVNIRKSRGKDIDAACGQLAGKINNEITRYGKQTFYSFRQHRGCGGKENFHRQHSG